MNDKNKKRLKILEI